MAVTIDFDADFDEQVAQARAQRVLLPEAFYRLPAEKRALAFAVSGLARLDQAQAVADALARNLADGGTFEDFRKWALQQDWSLPRHRLETIYRNAVQTAYMAGHWRRFEEVKDDLPYLMYDAINDSRTRPSHLAMDGVIRPVDDPIWKTHTPPLGHRCFLPGTRVRGNFRLGSKMRYSGPAVEFWTASGARLAVTANHPILTEYGFVAASHLSEGMDCLCYGSDIKPFSSAVGASVDDEQPPATVEDVFQALAADAFGLAKRSSFDLHGDAFFGDGDVHVAGANCHLMDGFITESAQRIDDFKLEFAGDRLAFSGLESLRHALSGRIRDAKLANDAFAVGSCDAKHAAYLGDRKSAVGVEPLHVRAQRVILGVGSAPGSAALTLDGIPVALHGSPLDALGLASASRLNSASTQEAADSGSADTVMSGKRLYAHAARVFIKQLVRVLRGPLTARHRLTASQLRSILRRAELEPALAQQTLEAAGGDAGLFAKLSCHFSGKVARDKIIGVRYFTFDGHVYDFETDQGWLLANGIVASNCRCTLRQLSAREAQRRGGVTQSIPAEAVPDEGWGGDPRDAWRGLDAALTGKLRQCNVVGAAFAKGERVAQPLWCMDGPVRDFALMQQAWIARQGQMPKPRALTLPGLDYRSPQDGYAAFMRHMGLEESGGWVKTASGDEVFVSDALFKGLNGEWKWFKRGRDAWALYVAEVILRPQEVWRLKRDSDETLYLLGRFTRGSAIIEAIAVFRRDGRGRWSEGVTAFVADDKSAEYLKDKRRWLMKQAASVRYLEV